MNDNIKMLNDFVLQQMAAESYLDGIDWISPDLVEVKRRLALGNNNPDYLQFIDPNDPTTYGKTRMTEVQANYFIAHWDIIDHYANDATGFSATLMRNNASCEYTLSMRSTEFQAQAKGGDWERDGIYAADGDIFNKGFAFGQIGQMEAYFAHLQAGQRWNGTGWVADAMLDDFKTKINGAEPILNVTGYSLSGNLGTVFTELHAAQVKHTYLFNAAGRGTWQTAEGDLKAMIDYYRAVLVDPDAAEAEMTRDGFYTAAMSSPALDMSGSNLTGFYTSARYIWALNATATKFTVGTNPLSDPAGTGLTNGADSKITQLYGQADFDDKQYVANSNTHATATKIFIEDQPDVTGTGSLSALSWLNGLFKLGKGDFGTTHSITLIADSLALMEVFQLVDPMLSQADIEKILATSSYQRGVGGIGADGTGESDSLENALDALRKVFLGDVSKTEADPAAGGFGNIVKRNAFYDNITALKAAISGSYSIVALSGADLYAKAAQENAEDLAYRYALVNLNPFALTGFDYAAHNANGELERYNADTGTGSLTDQFLKDRAAMLERKLHFNEYNELPDTTKLLNGYPNAGDEELHHYSIFMDERIFEDKTSGYKIQQGGITGKTQYVIFGSDADESGDSALSGGKNADHIYGDGGNDELYGAAGSDYLEGGAGYDTYVINAGDGYDTVLDSDGLGVIKIGGVLAKGSTTDGLDPTKWIHTVGSNTWVDQQNGINYTKIVVEGETRILVTKDGSSVLVKGWSEGELGINFGESTQPAVIAPATTFAIEGDFKPADQDAGADGLQIGYDALDNVIVSGDADPNRDDTLYDSVGNDHILGGGGNDTIYARRGADDLLEGGAGQDYISGGTGNDTLVGGADSDVLLGGANNDYLFGKEQITDLAAAILAAETQPGTGTRGDWVSGDDGADILVGDAGNDVLLGGEGEDLLIGGGGNDNIWGDQSGDANINWMLTRAAPTPGSPIYFSSITDGTAGIQALTGASDVIYGGAGDDWIDGNQGNDIIDAGSDNDVVFGGAGADVILGRGGNDTLIGDTGAQNNPDDGDDFIDGGDGNDTLFGLGGADVLFGGTGTDELQGGAGNDMLDGGEGDDALYGDDGSDMLVGGAGADYLAGGAGDDIYLGVTSLDTVDDTQGNNIIVLDQAAGLATANALSTSNYGSTLHVALDNGDTLTLQNALFGMNAGLQFANGDELDLESLVGTTLFTPVIMGLDNSGGRLYGGAGADSLYGGSGDDTLTGHRGNDTLQGGWGNDVYLFSAGDGQDTIIETGGGTDMLRFGASIRPADIKLVRWYEWDNRGNLEDSLRLVRLNANGSESSDYVHIKNYFVSGNDSTRVDLIRFADDTTWTYADIQSKLLAPTSGNELLEGFQGPDVIDGLGGNDSINGKAGDDGRAQTPSATFFRENVAWKEPTNS